MNKINNTRNEQGKSIIKEVRSNYLSEILKEIKQNPNIYSYLQEEMGLIEEEFYEYLFGDELANITVYSEMKVLIKKLDKPKVK